MKLLPAKIIAFALTPIFCALLLFSCTKKAPDDPLEALKSYLPGKTEIIGFTLVDSVQILDRGKLWDRVGINADKYLYNGFRQFAYGHYVAADSSRKLDIEVMQFDSAAHGFALYAYNRHPRYHFIKVEREGFINADTLIFVKGRFLTRVIASFAGAEEKLIQAAEIISKRIREDSPFPVELEIFPDTGKLAHSESVSLDDLKGVTSRSHVFSALYLIEGDTLTVAFRLRTSDGVTTAVAGFVGTHGRIKEYFLESGNQSLMGENGRGELVYCAIKDSVLVAVSGARDQSVGKRVAEKVWERAMDWQRRRR